jgi:hypothetical protein
MTSARRRSTSRWLRPPPPRRRSPPLPARQVAPCKRARARAHRHTHKHALDRSLTHALTLTQSLMPCGSVVSDRCASAAVTPAYPMGPATASLPHGTRHRLPTLLPFTARQVQPPQPVPLPPRRARAARRRARSLARSRLRQLIPSAMYTIHQVAPDSVAPHNKSPTQLAARTRTMDGSG